jgi:multicomponent Na+:H+ antiporter subunit D
MIGAPPVGGFVSKLYMLVGALDAKSVGIVLILITSTLLNAAYFVPVVYQGFFGKAPEEDAHHPAHEAPLSMVVPLCITATLSVAIGIFPDVFLHLAQQVVK